MTYSVDMAVTFARPYPRVAPIQFVLFSGLWMTMELFLNIFTEFAEFSDKNICTNSKRARTSHLLC